MLGLCKGCACGLYIPQLANLESSSQSSSPPPLSPPPQYSAPPPAAEAPHHPLLATDAPVLEGTETAVVLPSTAERYDISDEREMGAQD